MSKTLEISIRCLFCHKWFPSPIFFGGSESFSESTLFANPAQCPHCNAITCCNAQNFHARFEDGSVLGVSMAIQE